MRKGFLVSIAGCLAGAGLVFAQPVGSEPGQAVPAIGDAKTDAALSGTAVALPVAPGRACNPTAVDCCPAAECSTERFWFSGDFLVWGIKDGPLPVPLVTTSPAASLGILGNPGTTVLFGGSDLDYNASAGLRLTGGMWLNAEQTIGLETSFFMLEQRSVLFNAASDGAGTPLLAIPTFNVVAGAEAVELVSAPGQFSGVVGSSASSRLWGGEVNVVGSRRNSFQLLGGFRYLDLDEDLDLFSTTTILPGGISGFGGTVAGVSDVLRINDAFDTRNQFYGGQIGARTDLRFGRLIAEASAKVALGVTHQSVNILGSTSRSVLTGPTAVVPGGVFALASNIGHRSRDEFAVVPELGLKVSYQIASNLTASLGYTFLYWSDVVRPGDQVNRNLNPSQVPTSLQFGLPLVGPNEPVATFQDGSFWAHGISFGLALRY